jgi:hypothetical protein
MVCDVRERYRRELWDLRADEYSKKVTEIISALGEVDNVNEHGVYTKQEEVDLSSRKCAIKLSVAQGSDGLWRYGYLYRSNTSGAALPVNIFRKGHETRAAALKAAAREILERGRTLPKNAERTLIGYTKEMGQLSLF